MRNLHHWRLGFKQSSFRHITRVPQRAAPNAWARPPVSWHALVPFTFRYPGKPSDPSTSLRVPPGYAGDATGRLVAHKNAFNDAWRAWGPTTVTLPVLISGQCPDGADAMAEALWRAAGFAVDLHPADWNRHGRHAGYLRNEEMVQAAVELQGAGVLVRCVAFLDICRKPGCPQREQHQLMPGFPGHFSHGTIHCRRAALQAGLDVVDVIHPALPPF